MRDSVSAMDRAAEERFRRLFEAESTSILGYALRRTGNPTDAADVMSETFTVVWRRLDDVPHGDRTRPYLYGIARGVLANHRRSLRRRDRLVARLGSHIEEKYEDRDGTDPELTAALDRLGPLDREVLRLTAWEGLSPAELAVALDVPPATARSQLHRARERLRTELDRPQRTRRSGQVQPDERPLAAENGNPQ